MSRRSSNSAFCILHSAFLALLLLAPDAHAANRLSTSTSRYLLQHASNPVDWYPWGDEAFAAAKRAGKPIFLSVGYSTCHWCHVMERESFADPEIARLMNEAFVSIKVDREERPDIDSVYLAVTRTLTGDAGWPNNVVLTPDGKPFFAAAYIPKEKFRELIPSPCTITHLTDPAGNPSSGILPVAEKEVPVFFVNANGMLTEETARSGADPAGNGRSVAYLDSDADGDLDMVVNNFNSPAIVYRNNSQASGNHWLKLRLVGDPAKGVTRDAIGAQIVVNTPKQKGLWREVFSTIGYLSVHPKEQHVGLGSDTVADVTVTWPNGEKETFKALRADERYVIVQGEGIE